MRFVVPGSAVAVGALATGCVQAGCLSVPAPILIPLVPVAAVVSAAHPDSPTGTYDVSDLTGSREKRMAVLLRRLGEDVRGVGSRVEAPDPSHVVVQGGPSWKAGATRWLAAERKRRGLPAKPEVFVPPAGGQHKCG